MAFRTVVETNEVHIVQSSSKATPYGKGFDNGATYYSRPSWIPVIGVQVSVLPMSVFVVNLDQYSAYDNGKVPFVVDIKARFRVEEPSLAAQRIESFMDLKTQLDDVLRGAVRKALARYDIEKIMETRVELVDDFKKEVAQACMEFGVTNSNIEFMDIRDPSSGSSSVIADIMEKKKTLIEKESRIKVAENNKEARIKEIEAQQITDIRQQEAEEKVGERTAIKDKNVGIAQQQSTQQVQEEARITEEKRMAVIEVQVVEQAKIDKQQEVIKAEETKERDVIIADGLLIQEQKKAEGIKSVGQADAQAKRDMLLAEAEGEREMQMAPVKAQIELAKEIGQNA